MGTSQKNRLSFITPLRRGRHLVSFRYLYLTVGEAPLTDPYGWCCGREGLETLSYPDYALVSIFVTLGFKPMALKGPNIPAQGETLGFRSPKNEP